MKIYNTVFQKSWSDLTENNQKLSYSCQQVINIDIYFSRMWRTQIC